MADDALSDEIDQLVAQSKEQEQVDDDSDDSDDGSESESESKASTSNGKRRVKKRTSKKKEDKARTLDQIDLDELLPDSLPKPGQSIKSLGDMYAKYGIGERPEFKLHLYRSYPKVAPGGTKFDGFYDEYDIPITEQQIQSDYGGGQYRIVTVGPHPTNPRLPKHYESFSLSLAGNPNYDRMPRAMQGQEKEKPGATNANPPALPIPSHENPKLAEAALNMFKEQSKWDREERRRQEQKLEEKLATVGSGSNAVAEAERRRADDLIASERERARSEREMLERRMQQLQQESEEARRRSEAEARSRPSMAQELRDLAPLFNRDDSTSKEILSQILAKHRDEIAAVQKQNAEFIRDLRAGHQSELQSLRDAHQREIEAERQASRSREERIEERLRAERDERERDRIRNKEAMDERDRHWKDRMESAVQTQNASWEARHQASVSTYETRMQWLQQEIDKLRSESHDLKSKQEEKGDIFAQFSKYREMQSMIKDFAGDSASTSAASSGGGIGLSGGGDDWKSALAEGFSERAPQILERLFSGGGAAAQVQQPTQQQMQQFQEGQVVDTPQGRMEVVRNPADGELALAPKAELDAHRAAAGRQQQGGGILSDGGQRGRRQPPRRSAKRPPAKREPYVSAVPDLSVGLPKRKPAWEGGGEEPMPATAAPEPPPPPPPVPRSATRSPKDVRTEPMELSHVERQGLQTLAKEVHVSVQRADDPEEFVAKMVEKYPAEILQQIVGRYTDRQIAQGIRQLEPNSAGATPAGYKFIFQAFALMRGALSQ